MTDNTSAGGPLSGPSLPPLDLEGYRADLVELALTPEQETEFLTTLWSILETFVHLGIDIGLADPCGQLLSAFEKSASGESAGVESLPVLPAPKDQQEKDESGGSA